MKDLVCCAKEFLLYPQVGFWWESIREVTLVAMWRKVLGREGTLVGSGGQLEDGHSSSDRGCTYYQSASFS